MRYTPEQKQQTAANILASAGRGFRLEGFGGAGVDALAQEAGVTSGAFYKHFRSKAQAFEAAVLDGLEQLQQTVESLIADHPGTWLLDFVDYYFGAGHVGDLACGCVLPGLTADVARSGPEVKLLYQVGLLRLTATVAEGLSHLDRPHRQLRAQALLALISGGVQMSRALQDPAQSRLLAQSLRASALTLVEWPTKRGAKR